MGPGVETPVQTMWFAWPRNGYHLASSPKSPYLFCPTAVLSCYVWSQLERNSVKLRTLRPGHDTSPKDPSGTYRLDLTDSNSEIFLKLNVYDLYLLLNLALVALRRQHTHGESFKNQCEKLAAAIAASYGQSYNQAIDYLKGLAENRFWRQAILQPLPWHDAAGAAVIGAPRFNLHQSVLDCLAPANPLKAIFAGARR